MGLSISDPSQAIMILNVYMPYCSQENSDEFKMYLEKLDGIIESCDTPLCMVMGDFNADLKCSVNGNYTHSFGKKLVEYCSKENLCISDYLSLSSCNTFTYYSASQNTTSWLDHVVNTKSMHNLVTDITVDYSYVTSDHFPLCANINIRVPTMRSKVKEENNLKCQVKWDKISNTEREQYKMQTDEALSSINLNYNALSCKNKNCSDSKHIATIGEFYSNIQASLTNSSKFLEIRQNKHKHNQVAGWNDFCKDLHKTARDAFFAMESQWKSKSGPQFQKYAKISRTV